MGCDAALPPSAEALRTEAPCILVQTLQALRCWQPEQTTLLAPSPLEWLWEDPELSAELQLLVAGRQRPPGDRGCGCQQPVTGRGAFGANVSGHRYKRLCLAQGDHAGCALRSSDTAGHCENLAMAAFIIQVVPDRHHAQPAPVVPVQASPAAGTCARNGMKALPLVTTVRDGRAPGR